MNNEFDPADARYLQFLKETKQQIAAARLKIARLATREQFNLYWWLGERIADAQDKYHWGQSIIEQLAKDIQREFGTSHGFSARNLWEMRRFYLEYKNHPILQQLVAEIPWGQNLVILSKVKDLEARKYYIEMTHRLTWPRETLILQITNQAFERHRLSSKQHTFEQALPPDLAERAAQSMKDVYMLDNLGLTAPVQEAEIENRMVAKIKTVMLELGYGFSFIGNQFRISAGGSDHYIDLLFYNRRLQSLVALELKKGKFLPEYAGKMNFYLNLLDDFVREPHENPSIGIILCSERNRFDVEYTLRGMNKPVGVAEFRLSKTLPSDLADKLPSPQELEREILRELSPEESEDAA